MNLVSAKEKKDKINRINQQYQILQYWIDHRKSTLSKVPIVGGSETVWPPTFVELKMVSALPSVILKYCQRQKNLSLIIL